MNQPAQTSLARLEEIVGCAHVLTDAAKVSALEIDGLRPSVLVRPADVPQIVEVVRFACAQKLAIIPCGGRTKLPIGDPPARYDIALDLSRMNRVLAYDPHDLTMGVEPGVQIDTLLKLLAEQNQFLPLEVPFSDRATIGGIVATNSCSPLRHAYGGIRDFCLGMEFVTGEGVLAKSGGRVVKNVTGYDLHKTLIGSLGTLAVITRVNFRTLPLPQAHATFVAGFSEPDTAFRFCRAIAHSVLTPQMVEVADPGANRLLFSSDAPTRIASQQWSVVVKAAGHESVVERHARELGHLASSSNADEFLQLGDTEHLSLLLRIREFPRLILDAVPSTTIFRLAVLPTVMAPLLAQLRQSAAQLGVEAATLTHASGVAYVAFFPREGEAPLSSTFEKLIAEVFRTCSQSQVDAQAMLEWCPTELKHAVGSSWGATRPDFVLMRRLKNSFDPHGVLSPGRFAGGI